MAAEREQIVSLSAHLDAEGRVVYIISSQMGNEYLRGDIGKVLERVSEVATFVEANLALDRMRAKGKS